MKTSEVIAEHIFLYYCRLAAVAICITLCHLRAATTSADTKHIADSLLTKESVYQFTFTDAEMAKQIIDEMRRQNKLPKHELDLLEGDLWYNNHYFDEAVVLYLAALDNDSVKADADAHMSLLHRMISCYDGMHDDRNTTKYVKLLLDEARANGDKAMESVAMFNMGKLIYYQEDKKQGYKLIHDAIAIMERSDYDYKYDNLRYNYNTLLIMQQRDKRYEDALATLASLERVVTESTNAEPEIANLAAKELKTLYAQQAVILYNLGRNDEAEAAYRKWKTAAPDYTADDYLIAPFLANSSHINEALDIYKAQEKKLESRGDTITYHMRSVLKSIGSLYYTTGQYKPAAEYYFRTAAVSDSLKVREQRSSAQELATAYETHKKEKELSERTSSIKIRNTWLVGSGAALILLLILLQRQLRYTRLIKKKNSVLVGNIQELLAYKNELDTLKLQMAKTVAIEPSILAGSSDDNCQQQPDTDSENHIIFENLERRVNEEQLYLNPNLTRDDLLRIAHTDKNRLAKVLQQHEYTNTSDYINRKRLEYAVAELENHPEYTINAIAESCGLPNIPTFNRLFRKRFGMTPTEFRKTLTKRI